MSVKNLKIPANLFRSGTMESADDGTIRLSISSDVPYKRYDWMNDEEYFEVLDHSAGGVDLSRLKTGAPLLYNHDRDILLGTLSDPQCVDGRCYVNAKISEAPDVESYRIKMKEGVLKDTSIGYSIMDDGECIGARDGLAVYKFKFAVHEASLVTIPADTTVGVGRTRNEGEKPELKEISVKVEKVFDKLIEKEQKELTQGKLMLTKTAPIFHEAETATSTGASTVDVVKERNEAVSGFKGRCAKINEYVDSLKNPQWKEAAREVAKKHIAGEADFDLFRTEALDKFDNVSRVSAEQMNPEIGASNKDLKEYSLARAIHAIGTRKGLTGVEKDMSDATAKRLGKDPDGFFIPEDYSRRSLQEIHGISTRNLTAGNFASAGALIGTDLLAGSLIELLRNKQVFASLGTTNLGGLVGNIAIPRQSGGATAYWLGEGATVSESDQTFQQIGMTPHRLVAQTAYDKQLVAQASVGVEAMVRNDIAIVTALKKDLAILTGSGAGGEPLGIANTTGVQTVTFSGAATWAKVVEFETDLATANADQTGIPVFITSPAVRGKWKTILKASGALVNSASFLWDMDMVNGYRGVVSNQIASATNLVYFGVPSEIVDATWAGIDVVVNPFSLDSTGQIRVTVTQWTDIALRHGPAWIQSTDSGAQ